MISSDEPGPSTSNNEGADEEWVCYECGELWEDDGDDRWIVCDDCHKQYHLQCSGLRYKRSNYYRH